ERGEQGDFRQGGIISLLAVMRQGEAIETATVGREGAVGVLSGLGPRRSHTRDVVQVAGSASRIASARFRKAADESRAIREIIVRYCGMQLNQVLPTARRHAVPD